jgi:hypothetical protein
MFGFPNRYSGNPVFEGVERAGMSEHAISDIGPNQYKRGQKTLSPRDVMTIYWQARYVDLLSNQLPISDANDVRDLSTWKHPFWHW